MAVSPIVVRSALDEVIRLTATLPDPHESLLYVKAVPVDAMQRAGGSRPLDGLPFRLEAVLDDWDGGTPRTRASIASWAATWAASWCRWRHEDPGVRPDGDALAWLADNLEWAQENWPAMDEFAEELGEVRRRLREAHGLDPISSGRPCPVCDGTLVHEVTDDGVRLLGNIGAIARTATAFDAAGLVLLDSNLTSVFDRRLTRASRALNFALPIVLADRREFLAFADARPVVLLDRGGACTLERSLSAPHPVALVMGSERTGASEEIEAAAAVRCEIPISGRVESLNVSVAAGIALYARSRARRG